MRIILVQRFIYAYRMVLNFFSYDMWFKIQIVLIKNSLVKNFLY